MKPNLTSYLSALRGGLVSGLAIAGSLVAQTPSTANAELIRPMVSHETVFEEADGVLAVEAEHFYKQTRTDRRAFYITSGERQVDIKPDPDDSHVEEASGGAYLEILPDTRVTHSDPLVVGTSFSNQAGAMATVHYKVHFQTPGRYYIWCRVFSTGTEDNGVHVGIDGNWPESGQRWQTTQKRAWAWDSRQRTKQNHQGEPFGLYLDVPTAGEHEIMFSMREDGFEFDKWVMALNRDFKPAGAGPEVRLRSGTNSQAGTIANVSPVQSRGPDGDGAVRISGELKQWHKITLTLDGPFAHEQDNEPNPFTDYRMTVTFRHESGSPTYQVPGYFAADGNAAQSGAESGTKWRAHLSPDKPGAWTYRTSFERGSRVAVESGEGKALRLYDGKTGRFTIGKSDKSGRDFRAKGRLAYNGTRYLRFAGTGDYFLKAGPDSPETFLGSADLDGTIAMKSAVPLKTWSAHTGDWREGDPTWRDGRGKGLLGALNYLAEKGVNSFSFLTYNAGGDGDNVWPFAARDAKFTYDCSKLDQWGMIVDHAQALGLHLHFKLQETEQDDQRRGSKRAAASISESLDGGATGPERKLYFRELIARFGHALAMNWNLGEENTQTTEEQIAMAEYFRRTDPYRHPVVIHTYPGDQDKVYTPLLGVKSLTGVSVQNHWNVVHARTLKWIAASAKAAHPWVVANDEQGPASLGVPPDEGYRGFDGQALDRHGPYTLHDVRHATLWGNLMAGGAGVEYYFGYKLAQNDLVAEDFRSRDRSWDYCRIALEFFQQNDVPFWEMKNADALVGNEAHDNSRYCFAQPGKLYLVYLPKGGSADLDLSRATTSESPQMFTVAWFNPREGGALQPAGEVRSGGKATLTAPSTEDWLAVVRRR